MRVECANLLQNVSEWWLLKKWQYFAQSIKFSNFGLEEIVEIIGWEST